jgi:ornithine carbamoyltransferase
MSMPSTTSADFQGSADRPPDAERLGVAATAAALQRAALDGRAARPLAGKNLGLVCEADDSPDAALFERAARELGAKVVRIRPSVAGLGDGQLHQTARLLGRLYDAIECHGLPHPLVEQIRQHAGVPVFDGLASTGRAGAALSSLFEADVDDADGRHYLLQALLVGSVG